MKTMIRGTLAATTVLLGGALLAGLVPDGTASAGPELPDLVAPTEVREPSKSERVALTPEAPVSPRPPARTRPIPPATGSVAPLTRASIDAPDANLADWLLQLPDADLSALVGTSVLDGYVGRIVADLSLSAPGVDASLSIGEFLDRLDARITAAAGDRSIPNQ